MAARMRDVVRVKQVVVVKAAAAAARSINALDGAAAKINLKKHEAEENCRNLGKQLCE